MPETIWWTKQQAAEALGIHVKTLESWLGRYPDLPRYRKAGRTRFDPEALMAWARLDEEKDEAEEADE